PERSARRRDPRRGMPRARRVLASPGGVRRDHAAGRGRARTGRSGRGMDPSFRPRLRRRRRRGRAVTAGAPGFGAEGWAYLDGGFVPIEEAKISIATHAFNYGTGCFEGIRGYWNSEHEQVYLVKLHHHFRRLLNSCRLFRIDIGMTAEDLCDIAVELVRRGHYRED